MWRYAELLPVINPDNIVTLGEGGTPILQLNTPMKGLIQNILVKDESLNPTGSFKARGLSLAISKAREFGIRKCIMPSAGNAGVAMAAYCARAGIESLVVFPSITPKVYTEECKAYGSQVMLVDGLINDCGVRVNEINRDGSYFNVSTLKEPYRIEGKKTMGFEIAEQLQWNLPEVIVYPTGGGTGLIGIWKAFQEMLELGWIKGPLPKMVSVQTENCQPIVDLWTNSQPHPIKPSIALGLNVPAPFGKDLVIESLRESNGIALSVSEAQIIEATDSIQQNEGILISPEGAAAFAAIRSLVNRGFIRESDKVLMLNTGGGIKNLWQD